MPRAKSELTGQQGFVGVRLTEAQRETFYKLGGATWLRACLNDIIARKEDDAKTYAKRVGSVVAVQPTGPKPVSEKPKTVWQPIKRN